MPALALHTIRDRIEQLGVKETLIIRSKNGKPIIVQCVAHKDKLHAHPLYLYGYSPNESTMDDIDVVMVFISKERRGMGQAKNKVKTC